MTKREFMIQYVLNRAHTSENLDGVGSAKRAADAWDVIISKTEDYAKREILK